MGRAGGAADQSANGAALVVIARAAVAYNKVLALMSASLNKADAGERAGAALRSSKGAPVINNKFRRAPDVRRFPRRTKRTQQEFDAVQTGRRL